MRQGWGKGAIYFVIFAIAGHAGPANARFIVPEDNRTIEQLADSAKAIILPSAITVLVWNIEKARHRNFQKDFIELAQSSNLLMLEEVVEAQAFTRVLEHLNPLDLFFARSFIDTKNNAVTGVATGSRAKPLFVAYRRSPDREPLIRTPKMSLLTEFRLETGETLLAVNIHGINFVSLKKFKRQIYDLERTLKNYPGKVIFAGDFNSWTPSRRVFLKRKMKQWQLHEIVFNEADDQRMLDRVFVKGCRVENAVLREDIRSSDHFPLQAMLDC